VSRVECGLDGAGWVRCYTPTKYTDLGIGQHSFCVRAVDRAKNVGPAACYALTIEEKPPASPPAEPPPPAEPAPTEPPRGDDEECPPSIVGLC
jgi:hypothetical protein